MYLSIFRPESTSPLPAARCYCYVTTITKKPKSRHQQLYTFDFFHATFRCIPKATQLTMSEIGGTIRSHTIKRIVFPIFNHSRSCENHSNGNDAIVNLCKNLAVHPAHKLSANVKPQPAATNVFRIRAAPKALKNM